MKKRCAWVSDDPLYLSYHDREWGVPERDARRLFELLVLEGMQAGLSWLVILRKRDALRRAFADFDPRRLARFAPRRVDTLLRDASIVRHRGKIEAAVANAQAFLELEAGGEPFAPLVWSFVEGRPRTNRWRDAREVPAQTPESLAMSRELRRRGFRFVGPTICYAFMQAAGLVNDHTLGCFRHREIAAAGPARALSRAAAQSRRSSRP